MVPHFRLLTLGAPLLLTAAGETVRYRTRKHFALLIRLALEPGKRLARDYLIDLLWPDATAGRGRHSLSQAITVLRGSIGRQFLATHRTAVALEPGVVAVDAHELASGAADIRGRFLEGFEIRGARGFTEWRDGWAARLHPPIRDCLVSRMDRSRRQGDFAALERHAQLLQEIDPLSEDAVRGIMEARAWAGDRPNALKAFDRHAQRLVAELRAQPTPELTRVAELLREGRPATVRSRDDAPAAGEERRFEAESIYGREREFAELHDAWSEVQRRQPRLMLVLGDHGIGKTTLTNAFASSRQIHGAVIARAQAFEAEKNLPYAVLAELVRQLTLQRAIGAADPAALAELTRLVPEILTVFPGVPQASIWPPEVVPLRLAEAFLKAVSAAAEETPAVLLVDDVHLADTASMAILHILARKLGALRMLLILTARGWTSSTAAVAVGVEGDPAADALRSMELEPLSDAAAAQVVQRECPPGRARWGEPPVAEIVRCGCGNPLALELLTRDWVVRGGESMVSRMGESSAMLPGTRMALPQTVRIMVERQARQLEHKTRAVLDLAAVLGRRMGDLWLYQVIGCSEGDALYRLSQLLDVRLLRDVAGQLEFRNELVRVNSYYGIPSALRFELHRKLGHILEQHIGTDGERPDIEIAWHHIAGNDHSRAIPFALAGAQRSLSAGAAQEAERVLAAVQPSVTDPATLRRVLLLMAEAQLSQSKAETALTVLDRILNDEGASKPEIANATRLYASAMYLINQNSTAKHSEMATRAADVARECGDRELLARALFEYARAGVESGSEQMVRDSREELRHKIILNPDDEPAIAHHADAYCSYFLLDIDEACEAANKAVASLITGGSAGDLSLAYTGLGNCEMALCHLEAARRAYAAALSLSRKMGDDCRVSIVTSNLAASYLMSGDVERAIEFGEESLDVGSHAPTQPGLLRTWSNLAFAYVLAGRPDRAGECFSAWEAWIQNGRSWAARMEYYCDSASIQLAFGDIGAALQLVAQARQAYEGKGTLFVNQGALERLVVFQTYQTQGQEPASALAKRALAQFRGRHLLAYLDAVAAMAWVEKKSQGKYSDATARELQLFETCGVLGKKAVLAAQGFLPDPA
jgi:DNA-binding SARP family transcriptional activator/tetratricopeptide (TPR) repeat protein